jgi:uncharacterized membrane protein YkgB
MALPLEGIKDATMSTESTATGPVALAPGSARPRSAGVTESIYATAARLDRVGFAMLRIGLVVVLCWIGGLKATNYEAEGIVPYVANSPLMSFFYHYPAPEYREKNSAGELNLASHAWNERNGTYVFSYGLGFVIVSLGLLIAMDPLLPQVAAIGSFLLILMALTTLSFLLTTPEAWVSVPGYASGFPYLALPGLLVVKDSIMLGAAVLTMADSARRYLNSKRVARR